MNVFFPINTGVQHNVGLIWGTCPGKLSLPLETGRQGFFPGGDPGEGHISGFFRRNNFCERAERV